jgi:hypothetical protein
MQHLCRLPLRGPFPFGSVPPACQARVRFFVLHRIKPHAPLLVRAPANSFEFQPCGRTTQAAHLTRWLWHGERGQPPIPSAHRLGRGLPGYLIRFAPHAFAPQRQGRARWPASPLVFLPISTHFTATPGIPPPSPALKGSSIERPPRVEPGAFTPDLEPRLRALYAQ